MSDPKLIEEFMQAQKVERLRPVVQRYECDARIGRMEEALQILRAEWRRVAMNSAGLMVSPNSLAEAATAIKGHCAHLRAVRDGIKL